jgi:hypothetical protein
MSRPAAWLREAFVTISALANTIANVGNIYQGVADDGEQFDCAMQPNRTCFSGGRLLPDRLAGARKTALPHGR